MPIIRKPKPNPRFDSIDSVLFDLKNSLLQKAMNSTETNTAQLMLDSEECLQKCKRIEFVRNELSSMKYW